MALRDAEPHPGGGAITGSSLSGVDHLGDGGDPGDPPAPPTSSEGWRPELDHRWRRMGPVARLSPSGAAGRTGFARRPANTLAPGSYDRPPGACRGAPGTMSLIGCGAKHLCPVSTYVPGLRSWRRPSARARDADPPCFSRQWPFRRSDGRARGAGLPSYRRSGKAWGSGVRELRDRPRARGAAGPRRRSWETGQP